MEAVEDTQLYTASKRDFTDFLDHEFEGRMSYREKIESMIEKSESRLIVNLHDLREFNSALTQRFIESPLDYINAFEDALRDTVNTVEPQYFEQLEEECHVGFEGPFGRHYVSPRSLSSEFLGKMICVEGIVTKCSLIRPKVVRSVHYCEKTHSSISREYRDITSTKGLPTSSVYPTKDEEGNPLTTEFGLSRYRDHQTIAIQEMPERAPAGQLPRSINVIVEDDLVDRAKPGDRVQIFGIHRALPNKKAGSSSGIFRTTVIADNVQLLRKQISAPNMTEEDIKNIRELSKKENVIDILSSSVAPSIYGHEFVKKAVLLLLLGGVEKNLKNGMHLRGDINMLMVGDPSTAKSQMLRFVLRIAPLAINTTGRGSTGVGLTAAVVADPETGERTLQAGAMVLADKGVVCIDEFDKMTEADRVAMHEVMEQQTVTIAKAGVHTSLNARCSVIAAANPVYGQYDRNKDPGLNIGLPDSLLSRFDLLFIVLDTLTPSHDLKIADHVLRMHRFRPVSEEENFDEQQMDIDGPEEDTTSTVYQKRDRLLNTKSGLLTTDFLKKYIHYAKNRVRPVMSEEASESISTAYMQLRSKEEKKTLPVTPRTLETLIRLATAHAKCRLSTTVTEEDAKNAIDIVNYALFLENQMQQHKQQAESGQKRRRSERTASSQNGTQETESSRRTRSERRKKKSAEEEDEFDFREEEEEETEEDEEEVEERTLRSGKKRRLDSGEAAESTTLTQTRFEHLSQLIYRVFRESRDSSMAVPALEQAINEIETVRKEEIDAVLERLQTENKVYLSEDVVYLVVS